MSRIAYRTATLPEIRLMLDWAAEEGWNPGIDDADAFHAADPDGFFIASDGKTPIAAISVVNHCDEFAFLGLYLCRPEYRGRGIGFRLWNFALSHAGERTVGLDGVPEQQANYAKSGFGPAARTSRLQGILPETALRYPIATPEDFEVIAQLDRAAIGFDRKRFLEAWLNTIPTRKTVLLLDEGVVSGFATVRLCRKGCKIGPIIAPSAEAAFDLARQAAAALGQREVFIDIPDSKLDLGRVLKAEGFVETFSTARMYRGPAPVTGASQYAIATMELG